jgi:hypothetical protein
MNLKEIASITLMGLIILLLTSCAKEQVSHRYIVWDEELKKVLYCPTEQECERIRKIYKEGLNK